VDLAVRQIVKYPDQILRRPTENVKKIDDSIKALVKDLEDTMYAAPGVGLAANQIGVPLRVAVVNVLGSNAKDGLIILVNPEIIHKEGEEEAEEGCLSIPGVWEKVKRAKTVVVRTLTLDGKTIELEGSGLLARAYQHEIDHLNGIVFIDRLNALKRRLIKKKFL
jgi:peptide deformylase